MLYNEIIAVCSEIHTKHINTLCGQNVELLNVKHSGTYSNHWTLKNYYGILMTMTYNRLIQDLCSIFMNQNHRFISSLRTLCAVTDLSILQHITATNVKWSELCDKVIINQGPSASAENCIYTSVSEGRGYNSHGGECEYETAAVKVLTV
jgi:hypothetical protein